MRGGEIRMGEEDEKEKKSPRERFIEQEIKKNVKKILEEREEKDSEYGENVLGAKMMMWLIQSSLQKMMALLLLVSLDHFKPRKQISGF